MGNVTLAITHHSLVIIIKFLVIIIIVNLI